MTTPSEQEAQADVNPLFGTPWDEMDCGFCGLTMGLHPRHRNLDALAKAVAKDADAHNWLPLSTVRAILASREVEADGSCASCGLPMSADERAGWSADLTRYAAMVEERDERIADLESSRVEADARLADLVRPLVAAVHRQLNVEADPPHRNQVEGPNAGECYECDLQWPCPDAEMRAAVAVVERAMQSAPAAPAEEGGSA